MKKLMFSFMSLALVFLTASAFSPRSSSAEMEEASTLSSCSYQVLACDDTGDGRPDRFLDPSGIGPAPLPSNFNPNLYTVTRNGCELISIPITCPPGGGGPGSGGGSNSYQVNACDNTGDGQPDIFLDPSGFGPAPLPSDFNPALYTVPINGCLIITIYP